MFYLFYTVFICFIFVICFYMSYMFYNCKDLQDNFKFNSWDVQNVKNMHD